MKQRREGVVNNLTNELLQPKTEDSLRKAVEEASKKGGEQNKVNRRDYRARAKQIMANATEQVREQAITAAILQFIPVEQHDAVIKLMETVTREYYESIGLGEAYAQQIAREAMEGMTKEERL